MLILGIGNLLMGDEGVGVHAVRALEGEAMPQAAPEAPTVASGSFNATAASPSVEQRFAALEARIVELERRTQGL